MLFSPMMRRAVPLFGGRASAPAPAATAALAVAAMRRQSDLAIPTGPSGTTLAARNIAVEANQMKKLHIDRQNPMLAQQARRMLFATSITGQNIDPRSVALLLNAAVYFGMESDARIVRECVDYCLKNDKLLTMDVIPLVVTAAATLKSKDARELIEMQAQKAMRNSKFLDAKDVTNIISAFSKTNINHEKLFGFLSRRVQSLGRLGEFEASHLVILANAFARLKYRDKNLFACIARRAMTLRERMTVHELVPLIVSFSKIGLKDAKLSRRFASKAMEYVDQMSAVHVSQLFQAFAYFGIRYDQLFGVLTNRAVELIDEFNAQYISVTLHAFQRISINNPELFDNLAERALAVVPDHDAKDISKTITALAHFGLKDEELFKRLASHAAAMADTFDPQSLVATVYAFAKTDFLQQDIAVALSERSVHLCRAFDASEARKVLWAFAKFQVQDPAVLGPLFNRALALHFDFFSDPAGTEEIEEIFDAFGSQHCQALYSLYMSRGQ
jgi:hypothetical protein